MQDQIPCFYPLVWTDNGPGSHNQPDPAAIAEACANGDTTNGKKCTPYCPKNDGVCIRMTYTVRDGSGTVNYMSRFDAIVRSIKNEELIFFQWFPVFAVKEWNPAATGKL